MLVELGGDGELRTRLAIRIELAFRIVHQIDDVRATRIRNLASFGRKLLEPVKHGGDHLTRLAIRHPIDLTGIAGPIAQLLLRVIGKRAHHGDAFARRSRERQCAVILQQRHGFACDLQVELLMGFGADNRLDALLVRQTRIFEQAQAELECEDAGHGFVDQRLIQQAGLHGLDGTFVELRRGHDQVVAGLDRIRGGVHVVGLDLLLPHGTADVVPVGDQRALVVPVAAQLVGQQPLVEGDRHAVDGFVSEHERAATLLRHAFERRQEPRFQLAVGQVRFGSVAAALRFGIAGEMLGAGQNRILGERLASFGAALIALDDGGGHLADKIRILAERLVHTAPTGVAGDAQHGGERPMHAGGGDLFGGGTARGLNLGRVEACCHAELGWEDGGAWPEGIAVDAVVADDQRNAEAGLRVHGLDRAGQVRGGGVQNRADVLVDDQVIQIAAASIKLHHLADLLFEGHASEQIGDALFGRQVGILVWQVGGVGHGLLTFLVEAVSFNYHLVVYYDLGDFTNRRSACRAYCGHRLYGRFCNDSSGCRIGSARICGRVVPRTWRLPTRSGFSVGGFQTP